jgi:hypothetical protein
MCGGAASAKSEENVGTSSVQPSSRNAPTTAAAPPSTSPNERNEL